MVNAQEWLENNYPNKETRRIYINQELKGVLDCSEYKNLQEIFISTSVDSSKFEIKKGSYEYDEEINETTIISCIPAQTWLDKSYPKNGTCVRKNNNDNFGETREEITLLDIESKGLEGELDLSDFVNLKGLYCYNNCLTNLNISNCPKLEHISCFNNQLTTLDLSNLSNLEQLKQLDYFYNHLTQIIYPPNLEKINNWIENRQQQSPCLWLDHFLKRHP